MSTSRVIYWEEKTGANRTDDLASLGWLVSKSATQDDLAALLESRVVADEAALDGKAPGVYFLEG